MCPSEDLFSIKPKERIPPPAQCPSHCSAGVAFSRLSSVGYGVAFSRLSSVGYGVAFSRLSSVGYGVAFSRFSSVGCGVAFSRLSSVGYGVAFSRLSSVGYGVAFSRLSSVGYGVAFSRLSSVGASVVLFCFIVFVANTHAELIVPISSLLPPHPQSFSPTNSSHPLLRKDTWANSCVPEIITTFEPMFDTQTPETEFPVNNSAYSASSPDSTTYVPATTRAPPSTFMVRKTKTICNTEVYTEPNTVATETEPSVESEAAFKNEAAGFGGVPTALLVLALIFFGAAAVLAVCYVK
ncbi:hypothetical protein STEG23_020172, partial [Scotinomys teguina]